MATEVVVESRKKMMEPSKIIQASKVYTKICTNKSKNTFTSKTYYVHHPDLLLKRFESFKIIVN